MKDVRDLHIQRVPADLMRDLKVKAAREDTSVRAIIIELIKKVVASK